MFGSKKGKEERLQTIEKIMKDRREVTQRDLAKSLGVSDDTIADDLVALESKGVLLCQKGHRLSLLDRRRGNN
jgi:DeoR/GlpR family transcriptional regulator of sugar metabolism